MNIPLRFKQPPANSQGYMRVVAVHPYHGMDIIYLGTGDWQEWFMPIASAWWINGYTIMISPMEGADK